MNQMRVALTNDEDASEIPTGEERSFLVQLRVTSYYIMSVQFLVK